jgi:hypothetical protein
MLMNHRIEFATKLIKEEKFSKITKKLSDINDDIKIINKTFIDKNNKLEFITMLEGLAENNNVDLNLNINFNQIASNNKIAAYIFFLK